MSSINTYDFDVGANNIMGPSDIDYEDISLENFDIETLMEIVLSRRADNLQKGMELQMKVIQWRNDMVSSMNDQLSALNQSRADTDDEDLQTTLDNSINDLESEIDTLNNLNNLDVIRLQSLGTKATEALEMISTQIKKWSDNRGKIIGNM